MSRCGDNRDRPTEQCCSYYWILSQNRIFRFWVPNLKANTASVTRFWQSGGEPSCFTLLIGHSRYGNKNAC